MGSGSKSPSSEMARLPLRMRATTSARFISRGSRPGAVKRLVEIAQITQPAIPVGDWRSSCSATWPRAPGCVVQQTSSFFLSGLASAAGRSPHRARRLSKFYCRTRDGDHFPFAPARMRPKCSRHLEASKKLLLLSFPARWREVVVHVVKHQNPVVSGAA